MSDDEKIRILLVENDPEDMRRVEEMLDEASGFVLERVSSLQEALQILFRSGDKIQVVLLELNLSDENGLRTLRRIAPAAQDACVIVMTDLEDEATAIAALKEGAQDYLLKGRTDARQLQRAIRYGIERQQMCTQLRNLSLKDTLTGLHNRHGFITLAEQQMKVSRRNLSPSLLLFIDLDGLKAVNDTFGHEAGNQVILEAANLLRSALRQCDILARFGGDEFVGLILGAPETAEGVVRGNLQLHVDEHNRQPDCRYPISFSMGAALCDPTQQIPITDLLKKADSLMYAEKKRKGAERKSQEPIVTIEQP